MRTVTVMSFLFTEENLAQRMDAIDTRKLQCVWVFFGKYRFLVEPKFS
jgi:hypothetical protein